MKQGKFYGFAAMNLVASMIIASCAPAAATAAPTEEPAAPAETTSAIEHFSVIEGTTWLGLTTAPENVSPRNIPM